MTRPKPTQAEKAKVLVFQTLRFQKGLGPPGLITDALPGRGADGRGADVSNYAALNRIASKDSLSREDLHNLFFPFDRTEHGGTMYRYMLGLRGKKDQKASVRNLFSQLLRDEDLMQSDPVLRFHDEDKRFSAGDDTMSTVVEESQQAPLDDPSPEGGAGDAPAGAWSWVSGVVKEASFVHGEVYDDFFLPVSEDKLVEAMEYYAYTVGKAVTLPPWEDKRSVCFGREKDELKASLNTVERFTHRVGSRGSKKLSKAKGKICSRIDEIEKVCKECAGVYRRTMFPTFVDSGPMMEDLRREGEEKLEEMMARALGTKASSLEFFAVGCPPDGGVQMAIKLKSKHNSVTIGATLRKLSKCFAKYRPIIICDGTDNRDYPQQAPRIVCPTEGGVDVDAHPLVCGEKTENLSISDELKALEPLRALLQRIQQSEKGQTGSSPRWTVPVAFTQPLFDAAEESEGSSAKFTRLAEELDPEQMKDLNLVSRWMCFYRAQAPGRLAAGAKRGGGVIDAPHARKRRQTS